MNIDATTKAKFKTILYISLTGILIGIIFSLVLYGFILHILLEGALIGLLITAGSSITETFFLTGKNRIEKFPVIIIKRASFYILWISFSILFVLFIFDSFQQNESFLSVIRSRELKKFLQNEFFPIFLFSVFISFLINFFRQITKMVGGRVIVNLLLGKYNKPSAESRIFMFLDLKSSTELAEKLGTVSYSELLQDFFLDLANPVEETGGEIYQYVGDEVVLTWLLTGTVADNRCIDCFFLIRDKIGSRKEYYLSKYGIIPDFKAGIHAGRSVVTEVGDLQKEIVYHGDVLNTASRIQKECNSLNEPLLISNALRNMIEISEEYEIEKIGYFFLKGKSKGMELYGVRRRNKNTDINAMDATPARNA